MKYMPCYAQGTQEQTSLNSYLSNGVPDLAWADLSS